jgi:cytochrome b6-f complex iron-sulfur subunit
MGVISGNGAAAQSAVEPLAEAAAVEDPAARARREMNRREFLTYTWGAALGLVLLETGYAIFDFMYPRFKAGEFGGKFFLGPMSSMPSTDAPPLPITDGKFWLVNTTDEGIKALYMVCTHLGCLYKWEPSTVRFECPCHGSKFSREGYYIEGPAPRSLDTFVVSDETAIVVVDTGKKIPGAPAAESPAKAA